MWILIASKANMAMGIAGHPDSHQPEKHLDIEGSAPLKQAKKVSGPSLGMKLLILISLALIVIPWFGYLYLSEMEDFLVDSQGQAQLLTAEGISTLLNGRSDLFYELPLTPEGYEQLYAHPLKTPIRIDGRANDWAEVIEYRAGFGNLETFPAPPETMLPETIASEIIASEIIASETIASEAIAPEARDSEDIDSEARDSADRDLETMPPEDRDPGAAPSTPTKTALDNTDRTTAGQPLAELDNKRQLKYHFYLSIGEHNDQLYALVTVKDQQLVFRDRNILRLDLSDHLRLTFTDKNERIIKVVITMTEPGVTSAYIIEDDWRYALQGKPENRIPGFMLADDEGYTLEFRVPFDLLGSARQFGLAVVDVDDAETRETVSTTGTLPSSEQQAVGLVILKSPEVLRIIDGLGYSGANIQVIDAQKQVRAEVGSYESNIAAATQEDDSWLSLIASLIAPVYSLIETNLIEASFEIDDTVLNLALAGQPSYQRRASQGEGEIIIAGHPIVIRDKIIGAVLLKQNTNNILELRRDALQSIINFSMITLVIFVVLTFGFSLRLAGRISKLGAEASNAIDSYGRLKTNKITAETLSGDEIGDMARSISNMLARLHQYNHFLESMPRTLRHEINNPLNALSTSLQNLELETSAANRQKYLAAAQRGVTKIGSIVQSLADAASLEDALQTEELEVIDIHQLLQSYLLNCGTTHPKMTFNYQGTTERVLVSMSDYRVEQLLDKLIDNAVDFSSSGGTITASLFANQENLTLFINNSGSKIPPDMLENIFNSMVSVREADIANRLHFGMGLYVVRIIVEHHGGNVTAINAADGQGVTIRITLPLHQEQSLESPLLAS